jgi:hypothetical protein
MLDLNKKAVVEAEIKKCEAELKEAKGLMNVAGIESDLEYLREKLSTAV